MMLRLREVIYRNDKLDCARAKLSARITKHVPAIEVDESTRYISPLTGLRMDEPALDRDYLFFAARRLLESFAADRPALLIFEDLHWADAGLLDLIEYLATHARDVPIMMVGLARPEFLDHRSGWGSGLFPHTTIRL